MAVVGIGIESTIIDLTESKPMVLRPGYITPQMLSEVLGEEVIIDPGIIAADDTRKPKAPGMKYKHYAPKADMVIVDGYRMLLFQDQCTGAPKAGERTESGCHCHGRIHLLITPMSFFPWAAVWMRMPLHSICTGFCENVMNCT